MYFWLEGTELNVLNLKRTNEHVVVYNSRLEEVAGTFRKK